MSKAAKGLIGSAVLAVIGILLRLNAHAMAWPSSYSFSGPASETTWGRQETAIGEIGLALLVTGIAMFVITYSYWLFDRKRGRPDR